MAQHTTDLFNNSLIDNQTGKQVYTSSLSGKSLAGWQAWLDSRYTTDSPYILSQGVEQLLEFDESQRSFIQETETPRIGSKLFSLWDYTNNKLSFYKPQICGLYSVRLQCTARALTSGSGKGIETILRVPEGIAIYREVKPTLKGTSPQRISFNIPFYVTQSEIDNGLEIYLQAINDNFEIYNINVLIQSGV